ncbi:MAG: cardiolipin synthase [Oscillospiraceae bacterium]|nr:cardiolipin synthase [Oscillospiraceae bacterium]
MKRKYHIHYDANITVEREVNYIPLRYILALVLAVLETVAVIGVLFLFGKYIPYFYLAMWATEIGCVIHIIACDEAPDYKIPWLLVVLIVPVAGFMLYFLFGSRKLQRKFIRRLEAMRSQGYPAETQTLTARLAGENAAISTDARMLCTIADTNLFTNTTQTYFPLGEDMHKQLLTDLKTAEKFIFMDYFIIEEGLFWNSILDILKEKAASGVEVRVIYDDIGCMMTLPGNYDKILRNYGIDAVPFSKLKGNADSEFNNRSHRKITVIDGRIGYTGGVNIADEYINEKVIFGHWKDVGLRLEGEAVRELTKLFLVDYGINVKKLPTPKHDYFPAYSVPAQGYLIPFGDGPMPIYQRRVGKSVIENMLNHATRYFYAMTPYLILDEALCQAVENAALRGVTVKLILPGIPDKWIVKELACSHYERLTKAGVEIYEYEPGFVHAKVYLSDDETAMVGTINMDHRSLVHNFENGVWMHRCQCIEAIRDDFAQTFTKCVRIDESKLNWHFMRRFIRSVAKVFAPLM